MRLRAYVDADFAGCVDTARSTTGFVLMLGNNVTCYKSCLQKSVAQSSSESEYMAAAMCASYVVWQRSFLEELGFPQRGPTNIYEDNEGVIAMVASSHRSRARHIHRNYHFLKELQKEFKAIKVVTIKGKNNRADMFTKPLARILFQKCNETLMPELA
jgi:hypothetical protein